MPLANQQVKTIVAKAAWAAAVLLCGGQPLPAVAQASAAEVAAFENYTPCPSTGHRGGACPGYRIAHKVPLCAGGQDRWTNMAWWTEAAAREKQRRDAAACGSGQGASSTGRPPAFPAASPPAFPSRTRP